MAQHYRLRYTGSVVWLVIWAIVFFPIALVLLAVRGKFEGPEGTAYMKYDGSVFWLGFWTLFCFPVAIILVAVNGLTFVKEEAASTSP